MGIAAIHTEYYTWRAPAGYEGRRAQIDLIIERADKMVNLCEIKYSTAPYALHQEEYLKIQARVQAFVDSTKWRGGVLLTLMSPYGVAQSGYGGSVAAEVTLDDLFV